MSLEALFENTTRHFMAIDLCIKNKLKMPALILVYSGIDIFASLNRPVDKVQATNKDFIEWCNRYLLPKSKLPCSAIDLYGARCGVVHTYSPESSLSQKKQAIKIVYSWGNQSPESLQEIVKNIGLSAHVIHVEILSSYLKMVSGNSLKKLVKIRTD